MINMIVIIIGLILIVGGTRKYKPKFELVQSRHKYMLLFWYNKYGWNGDYKRTYIKLF